MMSPESKDGRVVFEGTWRLGGSSEDFLRLGGAGGLVELGNGLGLLVVQDGGVLVLEQVVVQVEEVAGARAWHSLIGEGAGEGSLVEHGLVSAGEGVLGELDVSVLLGNTTADVEDLAVVVNIGEVTLTFALEGGLHGVADEELYTVGKAVRLATDLRVSKGLGIRLCNINFFR